MNRRTMAIIGGNVLAIAGYKYYTAHNTEDKTVLTDDNEVKPPPTVEQSKPKTDSPDEKNEKEKASQHQNTSQSSESDETQLPKF